MLQYLTSPHFIFVYFLFQRKASLFVITFVCILVAMMNFLDFSIWLFCGIYIWRFLVVYNIHTCSSKLRVNSYQCSCNIIYYDNILLPVLFALAKSIFAAYNVIIVTHEKDSSKARWFSIFYLSVRIFYSQIIYRLFSVMLVFCSHDSMGCCFECIKFNRVRSKRRSRQSNKTSVRFTLTSFMDFCKSMLMLLG